MVWTLVGLISYSGKLCNKKCISKSSEILISEALSVTLLDPISHNTMKWVPNPILERALMVIGHTEDMLNLSSPTDVYNHH